MSGAVKIEVPAQLERLLTTTEAAEFLAIPMRTLEKWRKQQRSDGSQKGPTWVDVEGNIRYRVADLEAYVQARSAP